MAIHEAYVTDITHKSDNSKAWLNNDEGDVFKVEVSPECSLNSADKVSIETVKVGIGTVSDPYDMGDEESMIAARDLETPTQFETVVIGIANRFICGNCKFQCRAYTMMQIRHG